MDDASKTREELLLEVQALRQQLAEARLFNEVGDEVCLEHIHGGEVERQCLLERLEAEGAMLRAIIDGAPVGIVVANSLGHIILANRMAEAICGQPIPLGDFAQAAYSRTRHTDGTPCEVRQLPLIRAALDGETHYNMPMGLYWPDGTWRDLLINAAPIKNSSGTIAGAVCLFQDVSGMKGFQKEQQRLLAEIQNYSEQLRIANEDLSRQGEALLVKNEALRTQAAELKTLTRELEAGRSLLEAVLEQMPAGVIVAEPTGQIILTNRRVETIWGQLPGSLRDLERFTQMPLYYPDARPCPAGEFPLWRALTRGETVVDEEYLLRREAGGRFSSVSLNVNATPVRDQQGVIIAAVATYEDITARIQAQKALRQSEERYRSLVELSPDAIVVHARGKIVFVNSAAVRLFGAEIRSDLLGRPIMDLIHPDYHEAIHEHIRTMQTGGTVNPQEEKILGLNGEVVEVEAVGSVIVYQGRSAVQEIFRDITERNRAREALRLASAKLQALIEASPLAIVHLDRQGIIQGVNFAAESIFGWSADELLGRFLPVVSKVKQKQALNIIQRVLQGEPFTGEEGRARRKDGTWIDVSLSAAPLYDGTGEVSGIVGLAEDITARKQAEAALNKSRAEFEAIFNSISDAIIFADHERRVVLANPAVKSVFGYEPEELIGGSVEKLYVSRADFEVTRQKYFSSSGREEPNLFEMAYLRKNGSLVNVESVAGPVKDAQGNILGGVGIHRDITARTVAEAALKESQRQTAMLADFLENSSQPFAVGFLDGRLGMCNEAFLQLLGYRREELSRLNWLKDLTAPEWRGKEAASLQELQRTGHPVRYEKEYLRKDGSRVPVELFVHERRAGDSQALHYAFVTDITGRKEAEVALKQEQQRLFTLLNELPGFIFLHGKDYTVRFANRRCKEIFGDPKNEFCYVAFHQRQSPCEGCPAAEVMATQNAMEWEQTLSDGRTFQIFKYPFRDIDGTSCILSLGLDITARKQAEEALRKSEEMFRQLAENTDDVILLASGDWQQVHYISPGYERIWGHTCASLYQEPRSWLEGVVPEDLEELKSSLRKRMAGDFSEKEFQPFRIHRPDGSLSWVAARFFPIKNEAGEAYRIAGIATDITSRKEVEAVLHWRQEHLRQTAKMEAVGRLAGGVAHDFNNLLTIISGYGELLLANLQDGGQGRQQVQAILRATDQATAVTRQLLAFSRKQVLQPQTLDLNELIANLVEMFSRLVDENIKISLRLLPELGTVHADPSHMEQVLMNLVINAMDAMPQGGALRIETTHVRVDSNNARQYPEIIPGNYVVVAVTDTGIGMTREVLSHIFEPFFTTKERGKGTGLGLSMAYGIIKQSGGYIRVQSRLGQGSVFRIYLPRSAKPRKPVVSPMRPLPENRGTGTILLVEDEEGVRHVVRRMLMLKGYTVLSANDGQEALQKSQDHPGPIHLLLTDVAMPLMGGRELAECLMPEHPEMKVLFMSGHTEDGVVRRGIQDSVINFIQKPFRADQLLNKVGELLGEEKP